jgi:hypothetical protein
MMLVLAARPIASLVRLVDRLAARKVRTDLALGMPLAGFRFGLTAHSPSVRLDVGCALPAF